MVSNTQAPTPTAEFATKLLETASKLLNSTDLQKVVTKSSQVISQVVNTTASQLLLSTVTHAPDQTTALNSTGVNNTTTYDWGQRDNDDKTFFGELGVQDETLFVSLIITCLVVPTILISIFALICIRRHKEKKARRVQMLLRNPADVPMEEFPYMATLHLNSGILT